MNHWIVVPILLPLLTAAVMLLLGEKRRHIKAIVNVVSTAIGLGVAIGLLHWVDSTNTVGTIGVYLPGNWEAPFGIVLAVDRLSALMLVLAGMVGLGAVLFSLARWDRAGVHFHPLFQIQLMGLYGAFLTADLFNLFVFFEVLLSASYGLLLHGSGVARVKAGMHYIAINLLASSLFLIGAALIYGATGTLNMADLAVRIPQVAADNRGLMHAGVGILAVAFLAKAGLWPLNFWLVPAYSAASAPVRALFAIMTKVGVYTVLRLWTVWFPATAGASAYFGGSWLVIGGLATLAFGVIGVLASHHFNRLASFSLIVSSGTLLAAVGFGQPAVTAGALFYLVSSTVAVSAFFLLGELIDRARLPAGATPLDEAVTVALPVDVLRRPSRNEEPDDSVLDASPDEDDDVPIGQVIPAAMAFLGLSFIACTLVIAGMPPLSGFIGKLALLSALLSPLGLGVQASATTPAAWTLIGLVIASGAVSLLALSRAGIRYFWAPRDRPAPRLRLIECLPIAALLAVCVAMSVAGEPVTRYVRLAAESLHQPRGYIDAVMSAKPLPGPHSGVQPMTSGEPL
ncbi:MAG: cation:proton antiporter [Rhizobacter sp.]|jgi:multicomponent K+:H+ antiporter subunit D|nr:cation:proton antiporter [Rhizobacter sp.]